MKEKINSTKGSITGPTSTCEKYKAGETFKDSVNMPDMCQCKIQVPFSKQNPSPGRTSGAPNPSFSFFFQQSVSNGTMFS